MNVIEIETLVKRYQNQASSESFTVLKEISFSVKTGDFIAIMGPSGSGKSTLMNVLGCLDSYNEGSYKLDQKEVSLLSDNQLAYERLCSIGFVFQGFNLMPRMNLVENVSLPLMYLGVEKKKRISRAHELLERVGIGSEKFGNLPIKISGGQQQRVAIARALIAEPKVILADEPTGNLDSKTGYEILDLFKQLNKQGSTVILVTHDYNIAKHADRILYLKDGEIKFDDKSHLFDKEKVFNENN